MGPKCKSSKTGESIRKNGRKEGMQEEREGKEKKNKSQTLLSLLMMMTKLAFTFFSVKRFRLMKKFTSGYIILINQTSVFRGCNFRLYHRSADRS